MQPSANHSPTQPAYADGDGQLRRGTRRLILIRHAKAVEEDVAGDHARALAERGVADAKALGTWMVEQGLAPDAALCSTASRTRQTLALVAPNIPTILSDKLYLASVNDMLTQVLGTDDAVNELLMVCHNPGAHGLLAQVVGDYANEADADKLLLKFPTSACAVLDFSASRWRDVAAGTGRLVSLRY